MMKFPFRALAPLVHRQPMAEMVVSCGLLHSLPRNSLAVDAVGCLGGAGAFGAFADGCSACWSHSLAGAPGVQDALA